MFKMQTAVFRSFSFMQIAVFRSRLSVNLLTACLLFFALDTAVFRSFSFMQIAVSRSRLSVKFGAVSFVCILHGSREQFLACKIHTKETAPKAVFRSRLSVNFHMCTSSLRVFSACVWRGLFCV